MDTGKAYESQHRVHWNDPDKQPYTSFEFEQYAITQDMSKEFALQVCLGWLLTALGVASR